MSTANELQNNT